MTTYRIVNRDVNERTSAAWVASNLTNIVHRVGETVNVVYKDPKVPGEAEWGQLENGNWIPLIWNFVVRAEAIILPDPPPGDPPPTVVTLPDTVEVLETNSMTLHFGDATYTGIVTITGTLRKI